MSLPSGDRIRGVLRQAALAHDHPFAGRTSYDLAEFDAFHGEEFVVHAYLAALKRAPDPQGLENYVEGLRRGVYTKPYILGVLQRSQEGRVHGVTIRGLKRVFALHRLRCRVMAFLHGRLRLPVSGLRRRTAVLEAELSALGRRAVSVSQLEAVRGELAALKRDRLALAAILEARLFSPAPPPPAPELPAAFYAGLEDAFRGPAEEIGAGFAPLLPLVEASRSRAGQGYVALDLGCGRGEWLAFLGRHGVPALGVDLNPLFVDRCRRQGLEAHEADLMDFMARQPDASLGLVSAFHVVEHLPFPLQYKLLAEMFRVLKPGGLALLETPNARNILVAAGDFYRDPTHLRPVFPDTLQHLGAHMGFAPSTAYFYARDRSGLIPAESAAFETITDYLHVSRDALWAGVKP